jgi:hypothetical protein
VFNSTGNDRNPEIIRTVDESETALVNKRTVVGEDDSRWRQKVPKHHWRVVLNVRQSCSKCYAEVEVTIEFVLDVLGRGNSENTCISAVVQKSNQLFGSRTETLGFTGKNDNSVVEVLAKPLEGNGCGFTGGIGQNTFEGCEFVEEKRKLTGIGGL